MKYYYAQKSPRGFGNEVATYRFTTKSARDEFVEMDADPCVETSTFACSAKEAHEVVNRKADACTQVFNSGMLDGDLELSERKYLAGLV